MRFDCVQLVHYSEHSDDFAFDDGSVVAEVAVAVVVVAAAAAAVVADAAAAVVPGFAVAFVHVLPVNDSHW